MGLRERIMRIERPEFSILYIPILFRSCIVNSYIHSFEGLDQCGDYSAIETLPLLTKAESDFTIDGSSNEGMKEENHRLFASLRRHA
jgi:hypothetical protein